MVMVGFSNSWGAEVQGKLVLVNVELWSVVCWQIFAGLTTSNKTTFAKNKIYKHGERLKVEINILFMEKTYEPLYSQLNIVFEMEWYMVNYHTGTSFCSWISYRHLSVFVYYIHLFFFSPFFWLYFLISLLRNRPITVILNLHFQHWILDSVTKICRYIQTYLSSVSMVLDDRAIKVRSRQTQRIFPPAPVSRPVLKPTQPPLQWVQSVLSPGLKRGRGVTLTTHNHIVPRSWMSRSYK